MNDERNPLEVVQQLRCYIEEPEEVKARQAEGFMDAIVEQDGARGPDRQAIPRIKGPGAGKERRRQSVASPFERALHDTIGRITLPYEGFRLIFDTETEPDPSTGMRLRFGVYQIRGCSPDEVKATAARLMKREETRSLTDRDFADAHAAFDALQEHGFFYRADAMEPDEIALLHAIASQRGMKVLLWEDWLREVFIGAGEYWHRFWKWEEFHSITIGHNLPFDISTIATREWFAKGQSYGGFGYRVCDCGYAREHNISCPDHPNITIRQIAQGKNFMRWRPCWGASRRNKVNRENGFNRKFNIGNRHFVDTRMLARALLGPGGLSLERLTETLGCETRKVRTDEHGGPLTREYVEYAIGDVQATWKVYGKLRTLYRQHGVGKEIWRIYSEASLGAAYFDDMGVTGFLSRHPVPKNVLAKFMETFYGGRSEVMIRLSPRDIIHCDFKSQYPTVNRLMRLQDLLIAERIEVRCNRSATKQWLETVSTEGLREKAADAEGRESWPAWEALRGVALVQPAGDILPVRAPYAKGSYNIALPAIEESPCGPTWWTFADVIASRMLTGRTPVILETIEVVPHGRVKTVALKLFGRDDYTIDLGADDLFTRLIDLRSEAQKEVKGIDEALRREEAHATAEAGTAKGERRAYLDQLQLALKLLANATSYGKLVEFVVSEMDVERTCNAYVRDEVKELRGQRTEHPGSHFAPFGTLIPAAGRLLLAIAERLASDRGMQHVFCDTDSMCFARPEGYGWEEFGTRVDGIIDWFAALNPYQDKSKARGSIFNIEHGADEELRCLAVSAKRYALYRLGDPAKGEPRVIVEKISAHGLGAYLEPAGYVSKYADAGAPLAGARKSKAEPKRILDVVPNCAAPLLAYDLWREAIEALEFDGRMPSGDRPWLRHHLYIDQAHVGTAHVARLYDAMVPAGTRESYTFFSIVPKLVPREGHELFRVGGDPREADLIGSGFYGPKADRVEDIMGELRFRDTGELANITERELRECGLEFQTLERKLRNYFEHREATAWKPDGIGALERRHVTIAGRKYMGKESDVDDDDPDVRDDPRLHKPHLAVDEADEDQNPLYSGIPLRRLAKATGMDARTLQKDRAGKAILPSEKRRRIKVAIEAIRSEPREPPTAPKPASMKNIRNLTALGKRSSKGDTLRLRIEGLRVEPARSAIGRAAMASGLPRHIVYNWYKRGVKLSPEHEAILKEAVAKATAEDAERERAEATEREEAERFRAERRERLALRRRDYIRERRDGVIEASVEEFNESRQRYFHNRHSGEVSDYDPETGEVALEEVGIAATSGPHRISAELAELMQQVGLHVRETE